MVDVAFDNAAGRVYIPVDFGLTFYYMPEIHTPISEDSDEARNRELANQRGRRNLVQATAPGLDI